MDTSKLRRSENVEDRSSETSTDAMARMLARGWTLPARSPGKYYKGTLSGLPDIMPQEVGKLSLAAGLADLAPLTPDEYAQLALAQMRRKRK